MGRPAWWRSLGSPTAPLLLVSSSHARGLLPRVPRWVTGALGKSEVSISAEEESPKWHKRDL